MSYHSFFVARLDGDEPPEVIEICCVDGVCLNPPVSHSFMRNWTEDEIRGWLFRWRLENVERPTIRKSRRVEVAS